jgi:uncharacterized alpha-E superfamily protein
VDALFTMVEQAQGPIAASFERLDACLGLAAGFSGLSHENMSRAADWVFMDMGRRIERGVNVCANGLALAVQEPLALEALLEVCDSAMMYRQRYSLPQTSAAVLDLVTLDPDNPRSAAFQAARLADCARALPGEPDGDLSARAAALAELFAGRSRPVDGALLIDAQTRFCAISDRLFHRYVAHAAEAS